MEKYLGESIKKLGFGLMRLPKATVDGKEIIDLEQTKQMVDTFMANGFTYFDTAYSYNEGESEKTAKAALVDRYERSSFQLATKLPSWEGAKTKEDVQQLFYTSLERTGAGYFDYYLLHNLGGNRTKFYDDFDVWSFVFKKKEEGLIRHVGFSFHDKADVLDEILTAHPEAEFVQLQINYIDWESPEIEARKCYEVARKHNKPVIIMEPVKGGKLAAPVKEVEEIFKSADPEASCASWAIRFAASLDGIITVLSGMSTPEQLEDNISYMKDFKPLSDSERATVEKAGEIMNSLANIPCTNCEYCVEGCPAGIKIPSLFKVMNTYKMYGNLENAKGGYNRNTEDAGKASECLNCGLCEEVCPQHIKIREELANIATELE